MEFETKMELEFYNNISDPIIIINNKRKIIYCNKCALEFLGVNEFKLIENLDISTMIRFSDIDISEKNNIFLRKKDKVVRAKIDIQLDSIEVDLVLKNIKVNDQNCTLLLLKNTVGKNNYFHIQGMKKKNEKNSKEELKYIMLNNNEEDTVTLSIEFYKAIFDSAPTGIIIENEGKIEYVNKSAKVLVADCDENLIGESLFEIIDMEEIDYGSGFITNQYLDYNFNMNLIERKIIKKDNTIVYCEITPMCFIRNDKIYSIFLLRDITRRVNGENALINNRDNYVNLLKSLPFGVAIYTDNKFELANETQKRIFNIKDVNEMKDNKIWNFVHPDYMSSVREMYFDAYFKDRFTDFREIKVVNGDNNIVDVEIATMGIDFSYGRSVVILSQEITERKKAQLNKLKLEQAIKYDKLKTEFISNMSHELKTPLNIILSTIQVLQYNYQGKNDEHLNKYLDLTKVNSYRLLRLINNLIDVTRIDVGNLKMNFGNYDIVRIVEDITMAAVEYVESKGMTLIFDTDVEEKIIGVDKANIERIMLNLLSNAVKFSKDNGTIIVEMHDLTDRIQILVKDNGIGIPEDMQERIFDKFVQSEDLFTRSHEGSGIGLALVKSIVENHGGKITVKSKVDGGSEFSVELPNILSKNKRSNSNMYSSEKENAERIKIEFSDIYK